MSDEVEATAIEEAEQEQATSSWLLPFAFAKRHSVLVSTDEESGGYILHCLADVNFDIVLEVRRILKAAFVFDFLQPSAFELLLTQAYQRDSSEAQQMMVDIGNEVDLYSLADEFVESEDLLEN